MSAGFTPGPWSIVKHTRQSHEPLDRKDDFTIKAANGDSIVFEATGAHAAYATEANANLIAASPIGYAVADRALAYLLPYAAFDPEAAELIDELSAYLKQARGDLVNPSEGVSS